jgi:quercetin dioxygenase-like cupin family protein
MNIRRGTRKATNLSIERTFSRRRRPSARDRKEAMRHKLDEMAPREVFPGFHGRFVHSDAMSFAWWTVESGAEVPEHAHPHEQVVNVLDGELALTVAGTEHVLHSGDVVAIPGGVRHAARALTPCRVLDVFSPVREDYRFD